MKVDLSGQTALICGATRGIGRAISLEMVKSGARVIVLARSQERLEQLQRDLTLITYGHLGDWESLSEDQKSFHRFIVADLGQINTWPQLIGHLLLELGPISILVANSGGPKGGPLLEAQSQEFLVAFQQHLIAPQILVQLLAPSMIKKGFGRIINIISTSVRIPINNLGVSNTIRGAVASWSKTLANELGPHGITVNNILPGYISTDRLNELVVQTAARTRKSSGEIIQEWSQQVPLRRLGQAEEIAQVGVFLASPLASYINGVNLPVDGGRLGTL